MQYCKGNFVEDICILLYACMLVCLSGSVCMLYYIVCVPVNHTYGRCWWNYKGGKRLLREDCAFRDLIHLQYVCIVGVVWYKSIGGIGGVVWYKGIGGIVGVVGVGGIVWYSDTLEPPHP